MKLKTIMLIDDNETDQFLHEAVIEKYDSDIEIIKTYDGGEALNVLSSLDKQPDIILLDINMPGMNGFEFLDEYSKVADASTVVAMLSSSEQESDREKAMTYDCVKTYFLKPLDVEDLDGLRTA